MSHINGVELCRRLKGDTAPPDISVVMLAAALPREPEEPRWDVLLLKPAPIGRVIKAIHGLLDGAHSQVPGRISEE
ncbi:CheY-like chemotaxis protein [Paraburkholderia sp. UCT70]